MNLFYYCGSVRTLAAGCLLFVWASTGFASQQEPLPSIFDEQVNLPIPEVLYTCELPIPNSQELLFEDGFYYRIQFVESSNANYEELWRALKTGDSQLEKELRKRLSVFFALDTPIQTYESDYELHYEFEEKDSFFEKLTIQRFQEGYLETNKQKTKLPIDNNCKLVPQSEIGSYVRALASGSNSSN